MDYFSITGHQGITDEYVKKKAAYEACVDAGVPVPSEVSAFFLHQPPGDNGFAVRLDHAGREEDTDDSYVVVIDLDKVPDGVRSLRVICSP